MPKLSKNAELAQYYTYAQQNEANAPFMEGLDGLIASLKDSTEEQGYALNLEKYLLQSLYTFKQYCKSAAEDINGGIKKSPNLAAASKEAELILKNIDLLKEKYPDHYNKCEEAFQNFTGNTRLMTAAQWIEQTKKDYNAGEISGSEAFARIFAIRNLANAERNKRANIDKSILTASQIADLQDKYSNSEEFNRFVSTHERTLTGILGKIGSRNHGGKMEDLFKSYALKQNDSPTWDDELFARLKPALQKQMEFKKEMAQKAEEARTANAWTAAKWIESAQKRVKDNYDPDLLDEPVANILAIRMITDAQSGGRAVLGQKKMLRSDFKGVADSLMASMPFQDYMNEMRRNAKQSARKKEAERLAEINGLPADDPRIVQAAKKAKWSIDKTLFAKDHGEKFEEDFRKYLLSRPDVDELDPQLYGRILKGPLNAEADWEDEPASPKSMADAKYSTFKDYFKKNMANEDNTVSRTYHAAKMAAAADILRENPNAMFDRKALEDKARTYLKNPSFCMTVRDPKTLLSICAGDVDKFAKEVSRLHDTFEDVRPPYGGFRETLDNLKKIGLRETEGIRKAAEECSDSRGGHAKKNIALANAIIDFQDRYKDETTGPMAEAVNESMKMLAEFVVDSDAEVYLKEQLGTANQARGLKPGDPGYLRKVDLLPEKEVEMPEEIDQKENDDPEIERIFI